MSETLLSRYAESIFWLARYVERAENLARMLHVNDQFARDHHTGNPDWMPMLQIHSDVERFAHRQSQNQAAGHARAWGQRQSQGPGWQWQDQRLEAADAVLHFYVADSGNPTSIASAVREARANARTLRPVISTEMWVHLNTFHGRMAALTDADLVPAARAQLFNDIKQACQTHTGITEGTLHRDQTWYFHEIGRYIERADQTTRLLDIKYHKLLPSAADVGSPMDVSQWNALLRSAAGYHAYLRLHSGYLSSAGVAEFLLLNARFPRSVYLCIRTVEALLTEVKSRFVLRGATGALEELDGMRAALGSLSIGSILSQGLHEFLDLLQKQLIAVTRELSSAFFGVAPPTNEVSAA